MKEYYKKFESCKICVGSNRSIIIDFDRGLYFYIPNNFVEILNKKFIDFDKIKKKFKNQDAILVEYFNFLINNEIIFKLLNKEDYKKFPPISEDYLISSLVSILIIDGDFFLNNELIDLIKTLNSKVLCIIFNNQVSNKIKKIISIKTEKIIRKTSINEIVLIFKNSDKKNWITSKVDEILLNNIDKILIYNCNIQSEMTSEKLNQYKYQFEDRKINLQNLNLQFYNESKKYNPYFNGKMYINTDGAIQNTPENTQSFGKLKSTCISSDLNKIISSVDFQKYSLINKDKINVCNICEYRYMCLDNRIPKITIQNQWYYNSECNYNPFISKWKDEDGYKTLAECGVISNENGFSIDHDKIAEINKVLWGE